MEPFGYTKRQKDALDFIQGFIARYGYSPSFEEIGSALGTKNKSSVHRLVHGLADRGAIIILRNRGRSIRVVEQTD